MKRLIRSMGGWLAGAMWAILSMHGQTIGTQGTRPFVMDVERPSVCRVGEVFFDSDAEPGSNLYLCTAENTWTSSAMKARAGNSGGILVTHTGDETLLDIDPGFAATLGGNNHFYGHNNFSGAASLRAPVGTEIPDTSGCQVAEHVGRIYVRNSGAGHTLYVCEEANGVYQWGSKSGDTSTDTSSSIDGEMALFSGTGGKTLKRATFTGLLKAANGVPSAATNGTDYYAPGSTVAIADGGTGGSKVADALINLLSPRQAGVLREEFMGGTGGATGHIGELGWSRGGGVNPTLILGSANHPGVRNFATTTTAGNYHYASLGGNNIGSTVLDGVASRTWWIAKVNSTTQVTVRWGWANTALGDGPNAHAVYMENVSGDSAGNWLGVTQTAAEAKSVTDTGVALDANWHTYEIRNDGSNHYTFWVDGSQVGEPLSTNVPTNALVPYFQIVTSEAAAKDMDVDAWGLVLDLAR